MINQTNEQKRERELNAELAKSRGCAIKYAILTLIVWFICLIIYTDLTVDIPYIGDMFYELNRFFEDLLFPYNGDPMAYQEVIHEVVTFIGELPFFPIIRYVLIFGFFVLFIYNLLNIPVVNLKIKRLKDTKAIKSGVARKTKEKKEKKRCVLFSSDDLLPLYLRFAVSQRHDKLRKLAKAESDPFCNSYLLIKKEQSSDDIFSNGKEELRPWGADGRIVLNIADKEGLAVEFVMIKGEAYVVKGDCEAERLEKYRPLSLYTTKSDVNDRNNDWLLYTVTWI